MQSCYSIQKEYANDYLEPSDPLSSQRRSNQSERHLPGHISVSFHVDERGSACCFDGLQARETERNRF